MESNKCYNKFFSRKFRLKVFDFSNKLCYSITQFLRGNKYENQEF